jgi:hypothetical protein
LRAEQRGAQLVNSPGEAVDIRPRCWNGLCQWQLAPFGDVSWQPLSTNIFVKRRKSIIDYNPECLQKAIANNIPNAGAHWPRSAWSTPHRRAPIFSHLIIHRCLGLIAERGFLLQGSGA